MSGSDEVLDAPELARRGEETRALDALEEGLAELACLGGEMGAGPQKKPRAPAGAPGGPLKPPSRPPKSPAQALAKSPAPAPAKARSAAPKLSAKDVAFAKLMDFVSRPARLEPLPPLGAEERAELAAAEFGEETNYVGRSFYGKVVKVYDGDTLHVRFFDGERLVQHRFRMAGYDSPEMRPPAKQANRAEEKAAAYEARDELAAKIAGSLVYFDCVKTINADPYGRILAVAYLLDGTNLNAWMIASGHGRTYDGGEKVAFGSA